jgi:hypothetical protein
MVRSDGLCLQYKGFWPDCLIGTVWLSGAALSVPSAKLDTPAGVVGSSRTGRAANPDAEAGSCARPQLMQKGLPSTILLPQLVQNIIGSFS